MKQTLPVKEKVDFPPLDDFLVLHKEHGKKHQNSDLMSIILIIVTGAQPCDQYPFMLIVKRPLSQLACLSLQCVLTIDTQSCCGNRVSAGVKYRCK